MKITIFKKEEFTGRDNEITFIMKATRHVNVSDSFIGVRNNGGLDNSEFKKLVDILELINDGYTTS